MVTTGTPDPDRGEFRRMNAERYPDNPARNEESYYNTDEEIRIMNELRRARRRM